MVIGDLVCVCVCVCVCAAGEKRVGGESEEGFRHQTSHGGEWGTNLVYTNGREESVRISEMSLFQWCP